MRTTTSRTPHTRPGSASKDFNQMQITRLVITTDNGKTHIKARLEASDGTSVVPGKAYRLDIADVDAEEFITPRLTTALDRIHNILGRYYTRRHLKQEILDLDLANQDVQTPEYPAQRAELVALEDAAEAALRARA